MIGEDAISVDATSAAPAATAADVDAEAGDGDDESVTDDEQRTPMRDSNGLPPSAAASLPPAAKLCAPGGGGNRESLRGATVGANLKQLVQRSDRLEELVDSVHDLKSASTRFSKRRKAEAVHVEKKKMDAIGTDMEYAVLACHYLDELRSTWQPVLTFGGGREKGSRGGGGRLVLQIGNGRWRGRGAAFTGGEGDTGRGRT